MGGSTPRTPVGVVQITWNFSIVKRPTLCKNVGSNSVSGNKSFFPGCQALMNNEKIDKESYIHLIENIFCHSV